MLQVIHRAWCRSHRRRPVYCGCHDFLFFSRYKQRKKMLDKRLTGHNQDAAIALKVCLMTQIAHEWGRLGNEPGQDCLSILACACRLVNHVTDSCTDVGRDFGGLARHPPHLYCTRPLQGACPTYLSQLNPCSANYLRCRTMLTAFSARSLMEKYLP